MRAVAAQTKKTEILQEKEKNKKPQKFIVEPRIIVATKMEEICKMHMKSEKNWLDFLLTTESEREKETFDQESYGVS